MIKARYIGVDNELLQSGKVYKIKTISVMWKVEAVYHGN